MRIDRGGYMCEKSQKESHAISLLSPLLHFSPLHSPLLLCLSHFSSLLPFPSSLLFFSLLPSSFFVCSSPRIENGDRQDSKHGQSVDCGYVEHRCGATVYYHRQCCVVLCCGVVSCVGKNDKKCVVMFVIIWVDCRCVELSCTVSHCISIHYNRRVILAVLHSDTTVEEEWNSKEHYWK